MVDEQYLHHHWKSPIGKAEVDGSLLALLDHRAATLLHPALGGGSTPAPRSFQVYHLPLPLVGLISSPIDAATTSSPVLPSSYSLLRLPSSRNPRPAWAAAAGDGPRNAPLLKRPFPTPSIQTGLPCRADHPHCSSSVKHNSTTSAGSREEGVPLDSSPQPSTSPSPPNLIALHSQLSVRFKRCSHPLRWAASQRREEIGEDASPALR